MMSVSSASHPGTGSKSLIQGHSRPSFLQSQHRVGSPAAPLLIDVFPIYDLGIVPEVRWIQRLKLLALHTDHAGHDTGFSINNPDYIKAFDDIETDGRDIIDAIESRETYDTEDWLIIITSDHGGYNTGHGMLTIQERMTFIITK